jgi:hypothetical protein
MASTYSSLKIELIPTGAQAGTWGATTNVNLGTALTEAITGSADVAYSSAADVTVTLTDTNAAQTARNLRLNITESGAGIGYVGNLILGSGCQIEKLYLVNNTTTAAKTVKNTTGTGVVVPAGKTMFVYNNGTNVVDAITHLASLTLASALPVASGGTNVTSASITAFNNITGYTASGATGTTSTNLVFSTSPTLVTPALGVATATSLTATTVNAALNGTLGATTPAAVTATTGTFAGNITAGSGTISGFVGTSATGAIITPVGTTGERPSPAGGMIRLNSSTGDFEGYNGSSWGSIGGGATGAGGDTVFQENSLIVTTSYTLSTGKSAMSVGPITINGGAAVTIPSGYSWLIL